MGIHDVLVEPDDAFSRRQAVAQRVGQLLLVVVVLAALVGVFGDGPVSTAQRTTASGALTAEYQRFARHQGQSSLHVHVAPAAVEQGTATVVLAEDYVTANEVEQVSPQPDAVTAVPGGLAYVFDVDGRSTSLDVRFDVRPDDVGLLRFGVGVDGDEPLQLWQLIYP